MRIIVPIKQVPETNAVKMDEATGTMIREGIEAIINPLDLYAIEAALVLRERYGAKVIALSMGPAKAIAALREALAMGVDEAVLISGKAFAGSDTWATSYVLSTAIGRILNLEDGSPACRTEGERRGTARDLILCGERATDGDTGQVGPGIASFLNFPIATYVSKIEQIEEGICRARRLVENGYETWEIPLPAVLAVVKEAATPRLPTLRGKQRAKKTHIPLWGPEELEIAPDQIGLQGSPTRVIKIFRPQIARGGEKAVALENPSIAGAIDRLMQFLQKKDLL
jgi:electron transfer flavoprotein beta subunit